VIWNGQNPCPYEYHFVPDSSPLRADGPIEWTDLYLSTLTATLCPECKRLHLWIAGFSSPALIYRPTSEPDFDAVRRLSVIADESPRPWAEVFTHAIVGSRSQEHDAHPPIRKLTCACGVQISVEPPPWQRRWMFIADVELDRWEDDETVDPDALFAACGTAILCPTCKRLHLFARGSARLILYAPEEPRDWPTCDSANADRATWGAFYGESVPPEAERDGDAGPR
jgi:hypothetical protein